MRLFTMLALSAAVALAACARLDPPCCAAPDGQVAYREANSLWTADRSTVLAGDAARALTRQCSRVSPGPVDDVWTPGEADIARLEAALFLLLAREFPEAGLSALPDDYYRQYAGFIIGGRRVIYVNGVHKDAVERVNPNHPFDWRTQAHLICDGGTITFGAEYDPATATFSNFAFNGSV
jgi:hypothetical protein